MVYLFRCVMPNDRCIQVQDKRMLPAPSHEQDKGTSISYYDQHGNQAQLTPEQIGDKFDFEYTSALVFLHEKDLRDCLFQCIDRSDQCSKWLAKMREQLVLHTMHSCLSLRHVGIVDGVDVGHGVFAETDIARDSYIGEYVGLVSTVSETVVRKDHYNFQYPSCDGGLEINGREYGNLMRFINHSSTPNAAFRAISMNDIMHVICVTSEDIAAGSQITVDYGAAFWMRQNIEPSPHV